MSKKIIKNHVYKAMSQTQADNETRRLLDMIPRGGKDTRDAIHGLMVLANIGCMTAIHAMSNVMQNGYGQIIDEILSKAL